MNDTLIVFHYYEKNANYAKNLMHFFEFGYSNTCDFIIVISGSCSISLPKLNNVNYVYTENKNGDFGGYCTAVQSIKDFDKYSYYLFINCSVRGPFVSPAKYFEWWKAFTDKLSGKVGLVGSAINTLPNHSPHFIDYKKNRQAKPNGQMSGNHVQTTAYAMTKDVMKFLFNSKFYDVEKNYDKMRLISEYEINLSQTVHAGGWDVRCLLPEYNVDSLNALSVLNINPTSMNGDVQFPNAYFGRSAHPYELIFVKTERNIFTEEYLDRLSYSMFVEKCNHYDKHPASLFSKNYLNVKNSKQKIQISPINIDLNDLYKLISFGVKNNSQFKEKLKSLLNK